VDHDVEAPVPLHRVLQDPLTGVLLADVQLERSAFDLVGHLGQMVAGRRDIHQHQCGAVAVQGPGDGSTNTPRCSGDNGDPSSQRFRGVLRKFPRRRRYFHELAVHKGGPAGKEEPDCP
jgi:hypothetical protein